MDSLARAFFHATVFMNVVSGAHSNTELPTNEGNQPFPPDHRVSKSVVSSRMRLVFVVGLEGSGHSYVLSSFGTMFRQNPEVERIKACKLSSAYYITKSMTESPSTYAEANDRARAEMRTLALQGQEVSPPGTVAFLTDGGCELVGALSYPNYAGMEKVQQYIDVRMLAEVAEAEGVDLRIVYLKRSANDIVIADTQHRNFQGFFGGWKAVPEKQRYMQYMRVLFTDIAAMHSGLAEIEPGFVVCHDFGKVGDVEQAETIANFVAPSKELAKMAATVLVANAVPHKANLENLTFADADAVIRRFQEKLDVLEISFC